MRPFVPSETPRAPDTRETGFCGPAEKGQVKSQQVTSQVISMRIHSLA